MARAIETFQDFSHVELLSSKALQWGVRQAFTKLLLSSLADIFPHPSVFAAQQHSVSFKALFERHAVKILNLKCCADKMYVNAK